MVRNIGFCVARAHHNGEGGSRCRCYPLAVVKPPTPNCASQGLDASMPRCRSLLTSQRVTAAASSLKFLNTLCHSAKAFAPKPEAEGRPRLLKLFNWL